MSTAPPPELPPAATPQVLLFGHTGAGKSALLGALLKAAETQGPTLRGEVLEPSGRLASIRDAVYRDAELARSDTELTSYVVRLRPWREGTRPVTEPLTVVINDCSGRAAEGLIAHPAALRDPRTKAPVARAVIQADAIVLLVDASSDDEELREAFEEFDTFLTVVAQAKANAREVGGFPVLLVLTQCDRLARPGDTFAKWEERVRQRAERAWAKFDEFLKDADPVEGVPSPFLPFGSIDLTVYAAAVRLPKLPGVPAQPDAPFGVAELFRDCFAVARTHRERVTASDRRLKWTVRLALSFVAVLLAGVVTMALFPPERPDPGLAEKVEAYQRHEPEAAVRLAHPYVTRNKQALAAFRDDPGFPALPADLQAFVLGRLKEIEDYEAYRAKLASIPTPGDTRSLEDLQKVEEALRGELALPAGYSWGETAAGRLRDKWLADAGAIRSAEAAFLERYRDLVRRGNVLELRSSLGDDWRSQVRELAAEGSKPPAVLSDPLPGSPALDQPRGEAVTNRVPFEFERVYTARRDWDSTRDRLLHLMDLADALGLTAGEGCPPAVLVIPEPGPGIDSAELAGARWTALIRNFTRGPDDFREWEIRNFPDPARSLLADRLERSFRAGTHHVRNLIRARMGPDSRQTDSPGWWREFAAELTKPGSAYAEWGRLLHLLARLRDPLAPDPVAQLAAFLRTEKFDLDLRGFDLLVPPDLSLDKVVPAGPLAITITPRNGGTPVTREFKPSGEGVREGSATVYRLIPEGDTKLTYRPGDELRAELPVKAGNQEFKLVWETTGSQAFQFDRLAREPKLVKPGGGSEAATGVKLTPRDESKLPRLPVLFPDLRK